ncbi:uncharacterized protein E0L32_006490 [Thyridium curvatum]|uniref:Uncharacterized protein n=1 Tax=Thyridium curvatum TaxID=1093900 RepID=A0A507B2W1_9PEZI|nr:uncharacterized protein E0L32_006490 [Thyridium curvatum]TPX13064.1 hypothetical protein E0L32_006490 [Thyridium curvatum]
METIRRAVYHAILIGINSPDTEDERGLSGCVPDVLEITKKLEQCSIDGLHIQSLIASFQPDRREPIEPAQLWPTYDNIHSCLSKVVRETQAGDFVYIHFSGHSTLVPPRYPQSNRHTGDLALVVLDGPAADELRYFHSMQLAEYLKALVQQQVRVTIVLDCCYSGSTLRHEEVIRYLPYCPELDKKHLSTDGTAPLGPMTSEQSSLRGPRLPTLELNWLADPDGFAILTSSDATERAYGVKFGDGSRHGTLSYYLLEAFDEADGVGGNMIQLFQHVSAKIADSRRYHKSKKQNPMLIGNKEQLFFGLPKPSSLGNIAVTKVAVETYSMLRLHAGAAQGVAVGDLFAIYKFGRSISPTEATPVIAEASNVRGITSSLHVIEDTGGLSKNIDTGWLARAVTRHNLHQYPVKVGFSPEYRAEWQEALQSRPSMSWHDHNSEADTDYLRLEETDDGTMSVTDNQDRLIVKYDVTDASERDIQQFLSRIQHLASFMLVRDLVNHDTDIGTQQFKSSFTVTLSKEDDEVPFKSGCHKTSDVHDACAHPDCVIHLTPADTVKLKVENKAQKKEEKVFLYVFAMGSGWEITEMTRSSGVVVPAADTRDGFATPGTYQRGMRFPLENGQEECEEVVKIFLTRQPTSFTMLELPRLGEYNPVRVRAESGYRLSAWESEDWASVTFRVRITELKTGS